MLLTTKSFLVAQYCTTWSTSEVGCAAHEAEPNFAQVLKVQHAPRAVDLADRASGRHTVRSAR